MRMVADAQVAKLVHCIFNCRKTDVVSWGAVAPLGQNVLISQCPVDHWLLFGSLHIP